MIIASLRVFYLGLLVALSVDGEISGLRTLSMSSNFVAHLVPAPYFLTRVPSFACASLPVSSASALEVKQQAPVLYDQSLVFI